MKCTLVLLLNCIFCLVCGKAFSDKAILLEFKSSVSDPSGILSSWNPGSHHCSWRGVRCNSKSRVVSLNVTGCGGYAYKGNYQALSCSKPQFAFHGFGVGKACLHGNGYLKGRLLPLIAKLTELRVLSLPYNELSGEIPVEILSSDKLEVLDLEGNSFTGQLADNFWRLRKLRVLNLGFNRIHGEIPSSLSKCVGLEVLNLAGNKLKGSIPRFFGSFWKLRELYLSQNELHGSVPAEFGSNCPYLEHLDLSGNFLVGRIPGSLGNCRLLRTLLLFSNKFDDVIPHKLGQLWRLEVLDLSRNRLSGVIPAELGNCVELSVLVLSDLFDPLPSDSNYSRELSVGLSTVPTDYDNHFQGSLPVEITTLPKLRLLWAPRAMLEGKLPSMWGSCESLEMVNLAENLFSGEIVGVFDRCKKLHHLDLSSNRLSGKLDENLQVTCMTIFDVSGNLLLESLPRFDYSVCPHVPALNSNLVQISHYGPPFAYKAFFSCKTRLASAFPLAGRMIHSRRMASLFVPTANLTGNGDSLDNKASLSDSKTGDGGFNPIEIASIASASAIVSVLIVLVVLFFFTRKWIPHSRVQVCESKEITIFLDIGVRLTYENIVRATGNFNSSNCIGNGGFGATYKAEIYPGTLVAVKKLAVGRFQGVQQFDAEIKNLGRLRHPNLVTLIGYHASESEMFLIYNYFAGGNLENFIKERSTRPVDWKILHKIALHVARALAYLHDRCAPRVLHRDVKPSNILLDHNLDAYLSDFGLSRLLGTSETHATTSVAGTFGYVAPEYAMTCRVSDKADVYSYGVVLLELISDKKPWDPSFSEHENGFNIVSWACMLLQNGRSKEVFTARLWDSGPHDDLVEMLHLAVRCTDETLSGRPTMREVVERLKQIQPS